jgi:uncharacterized protein (DUF2267 family)
VIAWHDDRRTREKRPHAMSSFFEGFSAEADRFLTELADLLGHHNDHPRAYRILRRVMHALRRQLSVDESLQLVAQLPLMLKGIYVDGWRTNTNLRARQMRKFIELMRAEDQADPGDLPDDAVAQNAIRCVFAALQRYVSAGEMQDIIAQLPRDMKALGLSPDARS